MIPDKLPGQHPDQRATPIFELDDELDEDDLDEDEEEDEEDGQKDDEEDEEDEEEDEDEGDEDEPETWQVVPLTGQDTARDRAHLARP